MDEIEQTKPKPKRTAYTKWRESMIQATDQIDSETQELGSHFERLSPSDVDPFGKQKAVKRKPEPVTKAPKVDLTHANRASTAKLMPAIEAKITAMIEERLRRRYPKATTEESRKRTEAAANARRKYDQASSVAITIKLTPKTWDTIKAEAEKFGSKPRTIIQELVHLHARAHSDG